MKTIKLDNEKIVALLNEKDLLVKDGRAISVDIEKIEKKIAKNDEKQRKVTEKVEPTELIDKGRKIQEQVNELFKELDLIGDQIMKEKLDAIPEKTKEEYFALKAEKDTLETNRNKIALKIQKIKDKVVPIIQKEMKKHLGEYEDIETASVKGNQVEISIYSHLEEWKKKFNKKKK